MPQERYGEELNRVLAQNIEFKAKIDEYEKERKYFSAVQRAQTKDLVQNSHRDNRPYIEALEAENYKLKRDKHSQQLMFNQAIKEQVDIHSTNVRLRDDIRALEGQSTNRSTMGGAIGGSITQVLSDPELQDQVAREMVEVARLQKQCMVLQKSNASLRQQKSIRCQALLKKLDEKQVDMEMLKEQLKEKDKEI